MRYVSTLASATKGQSRRRRTGKNKKDSLLEKFFCNSRTSTDEFALLGLDNSCQDYFNDFGSFLDKKSLNDNSGTILTGSLVVSGFDPDIL